MKDEPVKSRGKSLRRILWLAAFRGSGVTLICCLVVILGLPQVVYASKWIYLVAIGSAVLCAVAAAQLRSFDRVDAADDAAWLVGRLTRRSRIFDFLDDLDD